MGIDPGVNEGAMSAWTTTLIDKPRTSAIFTFPWNTTSGLSSAPSPRAFL